MKTRRKNQSHDPGSARVGRRMRAVLSYVQKHPGVSMAGAIQHLESQHGRTPFSAVVHRAMRVGLVRYKRADGHYRLYPGSSKRDPGRRSAARIPKGKRASTSREIRELVKHGYSPQYAATKAYREHRHDPGLTGRARIMMAMARNSPGEEVHVALPEEKRAVARLERKGLVTVRRTKHKIGGLTEWYFRATPAGLRDPGRLSTAGRKRLKASRFALPARRSLPLTNAAHVRNAAARLSQMHKRGTVTENEYRLAHARIRRAARRFGVKAA